MTTTFVQPGDVVTLTAPYDRTSGQAAKVGAFFGVAATTVLNGAAAEFQVRGAFTLPKATGAISQGDRLYWDDSAKNLTKTATAGMFVGVALAAALSGDATVKVRLNSASPELDQGKQAAVTALTAATGSASTTLADVTATPTQTLINNNFKSVATQLNAVIAALQAAGILT